MKIRKKRLTPEQYYDTHDLLKEMREEEIALSLEDALREDILGGKRRRRLRNISLKLDPLYLQTIKKIATMKGIPYQTLVRQWLSEKIRKEMKIA